MNTYLFKGLVLPEHAIDCDLSIETALAMKVMDAGFNFEASLSIQGAQVLVEVKNVDGDPGMDELQNYVRDGIVRPAIDALNYLWGRGYDVSITSVVMPTGKEISFGVGIQELWEARDERPLTFENFERLWAVLLQSPELRRALGNLREAIRLSEDTGFFCYRAVESLRHHFYRKTDTKSNGKVDTEPSWKRLREALRIDRSWIDALKPFADEQRHGKLPYMSGLDRVSAMQYTWKVVDRFCIYADRGFIQLPESEFEKLKAT